MRISYIILYTNNQFIVHEKNKHGTQLLSDSQHIEQH